MTKAPVLFMSTVIAVVFLSSIGVAVQGVRSHLEPASTYRRALNDWKNGQHVVAIRGFLESYTIGIEAETRWFVAQPFIAKMDNLYSSGSWEEALAMCTRASQIIGRYDSEGAFSYGCSVIDQQIRINEICEDCDDL